ncbi:MAG: response regulator [bacterium]
MSKEKILIVDDEPSFCQTLSDILTAEGYEPFCVCTGREAINAAIVSFFNLALIDLKLPDLPGIEVLTEIKKVNQDTEVVIITGHASLDTAIQAMQDAVFSYVIKPINIDYLLAIITKALERQKLKMDQKKKEEELRKYRLHLEELIQERTAQLTKVNEQLQQEIAEHKKSEESLKESEKKYSTLVEQAKDGVIIIQDRVCKFANKAMAEILGYTVEEMNDKNIIDIVASECKDRETGEYIESCLTSERTNFSCELKIKHKDGTIKEAEASTEVINYNKKTAIMGIIRDITDRKRMEEELQKTQRLESLGILAGGIAHDFNNLLTAIIGNLSLGKLYLKSNSPTYEVLTSAERASQQARCLTQQLLTFSKGGEPVRKITAISTVIKNSIDLVLSGSNVRRRLSLPDNLWLAEIDEGQISQAINNILINADQAMPEGGTIEIKAENIIVRAEDEHLLEEGKYIKISIKDHGMGMPGDYLKKIFDPYFTTKQKGSGLGLAITYSIIKKHEGHIIVESKIGVGTTFHIFFPAVEKEILEEREDEKKKDLSGKGRILFMDDQGDIRDMVEAMLTYLGYEVICARDGAEAVKLYAQMKKKRQIFDAVILDITVPGGMGGKETIKELCEIDPKVTAIISSGYSNDPIMSDYKRYGFKGVLSKPYEIKELSDVLHKVIDTIPVHPKNTQFKSKR